MIWICLVLIVFNLIIDGSLFRLWSMHRDYKKIQNNIELLKQKNDEVKAHLARAQDPAFLEREARDRFDLVQEGDLVFIFSEEGSPN